MADVKWIKITTDIFDDEKILMIESMPSSDSIIVIWFKLLTFAGKQNNDGVFMMSNRIAYTDEMLASIFRRDVNTVRLALKAFEQFGMIEIIDNVITIPNWCKHQSLDAYEKKKVRDRERIARKRAEQKALIAMSPDKSPDKSPDVAFSEEDKEREKERDKEEDNNTDSKPNRKAAKKVIYFPLDEQLNSTFLDFIEMRKKIKAPMTERAITLMLNKIDRLAGTDSVLAINILEQSIMNGWKDVYPLKENKNFTNPNGKTDWSKPIDWDNV